MAETQKLRRELNLFDAVLLGLGSIIGTGVFVSLGFVIGLAGSLTVPVVLIAGLIALCNGLSSAQLAAVHPVAGGTYEYGYKFLGPWRGRLAGWMFLVAKTASAATAALGAAAMLVEFRIVMFGFTVSPNDDLLRATASIIGVVLLGVLTHLGVRRASWANAILVTCGVVPLLVFFVSVGILPYAYGNDRFSGHDPDGLSTGAAVALAFVAFTGYGRVATLGEEVKRPRRTIPIAMVLTLAACLAVYIGTAWAFFTTSSDVELGGSNYLLYATYLWHGGSTSFNSLYATLTFGGVAAMIGVVLNLILGLSRVVLAMARRGDLPAIFARVHDDGRSPGWAVLLVTVSIAVIAAFGGIKTSWTVSALTVLIYYGLTNWASLQVEIEDRFIPRWVSVAGLAGCVFFAPFALLELLSN